MSQRQKLCFFVTEDWYFVSHRIALAVAAKEAGYDVAVVTRVRDHGETIRKAGLRLIPFEIARGGLNPLGEIWTIVRLIQVWRHERPDIVHNVAIKPVLYGSIAARFTGVERIVNAVAGMGWLFSDGSAVARVLKSLVRLALRWVLRRGTVIVQNPDDAAVISALGVAEARIRRIAGSGVDLEVFSPHPEPDGSPIVVLTARLLWNKGVGEFVEAAYFLKQWGVNARFVIAGEPDEASPSAVSRQQLEKWVADGIVEHRGWVKDISALLRGSHIVCLPSFYGEGIPKALIEGAAAGRPIVTTDMAGCREIVYHGENGLLVPPRDPSALARALATLATDPELRKRMGARGRVRAEREFGLQSVISQTLCIYNRGCHSLHDEVQDRAEAR